MCMGCVSNADFFAMNGMLAMTAASGGAKRFLADLGFAIGPTRAEKDVHVVTFLRGLDLDPAEILGAGVVADADEAARSLPIRRPYRLAAFFGSRSSHRRLALQ